MADHTGKKSIDHSSVTNDQPETKDFESTQNTQGTSTSTTADKKRHISQVSETPNKQKQHRKRLNREDTSDSETEHSPTILSDIESLADSDTEQGEYTTNMSDGEAGKDLPTVKLDEADFTRLFYKVIKSEEYKNELKKLIGTRVDQLEQDVSKLKIDVDKQETALATLRQNDLTLEEKDEQLDQRQRLNNVRITGEPESDTKENVDKTVLQIIKDLGCDLTIKDIDKSYRLGKKDPKNPTKIRAIIVEFGSYRAKKTIFKQRTQLSKKHKDGVWLSDDLTPQRSNTMWICRKMKKQKHIFEYWSFEGEVFIKIIEDGEAIRIKAAEELKKFIPPGSSVAEPKSLTRLASETPQDLGATPMIQ